MIENCLATYSFVSSVKIWNDLFEIRSDSQFSLYMCILVEKVYLLLKKTRQKFCISNFKYYYIIIWKRKVCSLLPWFVPQSHKVTTTLVWNSATRNRNCYLINRLIQEKIWPEATSCWMCWWFLLLLFLHGRKGYHKYQSHFLFKVGSRCLTFFWSS
jgi:hypothetical protein